MSNVREKMALSLWKMKSLRRKDDQFSLPETLQDPRSMLVTMPFDSREFEMANEALDRIDNVFPRTKISVCLNETFSTWIPRMLIQRSIIVNPSDFNMLGFPKTSLINKVKAQKSDVAIDLNPDFHLGYASLCTLSGARVRVALEKPFCHLFFNFVVCSDPSNRLRHRYDSLVKYFVPTSLVPEENSDIF